jgi:hypothetical protein
MTGSFPSSTQTPSPNSSQVENRPSEFSRDKDCLYVLPLSIIPLETPGLKRARLVKNARLESAVEVFHGPDTGSGRWYDPNQLNQVFDWPQDPVHPDLTIIKALIGLHSYDVFSLRIELRRLNIRVDDHSELRLSEEKSRELTTYMAEFTRPLIQQIYGNTNTEIADVNDLIAMFSNPDKKEALKNLRLMADKLSVRMEDVPTFLEDYGDIFLSLAYFKEELDEIIPSISDLITVMRELKLNHQWRQEKHFLSTCDNMETSFTDIISSITARFENFDQHSQSLWDNITAESFRRVKELIIGHHTTVGGVLCGLKVKMDPWNEKFGRGQGGPIQRSDFIMTELKEGIDVITRLENEAPPIVMLLPSASKA